MCVLSISVFVIMSGVQSADAEEEQGDADESAQEAEASDAETADEQNDGETEAESGGQMGRRTLHMGPQNVTGQWVRAGAIQLVRRTPRQLHELVSLRTTFRDRIVAPVYRSSNRP